MEEEAREFEAIKRKIEEEARLEAEKQRLEEIVRQQEAEKEERRRMAAELKRKAEALEAEEREREEERKKKQRTQECFHIDMYIMMFVHTCTCLNVYVQTLSVLKLGMLLVQEILKFLIFRKNYQNSNFW